MVDTKKFLLLSCLVTILAVCSSGCTFSCSSDGFSCQSNNGPGPGGEDAIIGAVDAFNKSLENTPTGGFGTKETTPSTAIAPNPPDLTGRELNRELKHVRDAMTSLMDEYSRDTVTPQTTWKNDISADLFVCSGFYPCISSLESWYLDYDVIESIKGYYQWDREGNVYQCEDTNCPDPF